MKNLKEAQLIVDQLNVRIANLEEIVEFCDSRLEALESAPVRDRGPKSTREMTEDDAKRAMFGDLKAVSHKEAAKTLGLSYGQIYSARGGYTFKKLQPHA